MFVIALGVAIMGVTQIWMLALRIINSQAPNIGPVLKSPTGLCQSGFLSGCAF